MTNQQAGTAYLGPHKGRWTPASWDDVLQAAAGGLIDESHWVELKEKLPAGQRGENKKMARELASLAVDGGVVIIGVEDDDGRAGGVCGVTLANLDTQVDQIARSKIQPPLTVRTKPIRDPNRPGFGCLLVHIPRSADAPHMVDGVYYGRGAVDVARLTDEQVRQIMEERRRGRIDAKTELRRMADEDPFPAVSREFGHVYLTAQPVAAHEEALVEFLSHNDREVARRVRDVIAKTADELQLNRSYPDIRLLSDPIRRAQGLALVSYNAEEGRPRREEGLLDLEIREDGGLRLVCGRGATYESGFRSQGEQPLVVYPGQVLDLAHVVAALAGRLADVHTGYQGLWDLGIRLDRLQGTVPYELVQSPFDRVGNPYSRGEYEKVTSASTEDLVRTPHVVAERLVAPLVRGLGVAGRYLPYRN